AQPGRLTEIPGYRLVSLRLLGGLLLKDGDQIAFEGGDIRRGKVGARKKLPESKRLSEHLVGQLILSGPRNDGRRRRCATTARLRRQRTSQDTEIQDRDPTAIRLNHIFLPRGTTAPMIEDSTLLRSIRLLENPRDPRGFFSSLLAYTPRLG